MHTRTGPRTVFLNALFTLVMNDRCSVVRLGRDDHPTKRSLGRNPHIAGCRIGEQQSPASYYEYQCGPAQPGLSRSRLSVFS